MSIYSLFATGRDALQAQSFALTITGQNIANVNTPGYVRRQAMIEARASGGPTTGGVEVVGLSRAYDKFTERRLLDVTGEAGAAMSRDAALGRVEALFNDAAGSGLAGPIHDLMASFATLAIDPQDTAARNTLLERVDGISARLRETSANLQSQKQDLFLDAQGYAGEITELSSKIATLNKLIAQNEGSGGDAADLKDKRDVYLTELADKAGADSFFDGTGRLVVRMGGATLVEGDIANRVAVDLGTIAPFPLVVSVNGPGTLVTDVTGNLARGKLAGVVQARDVDLAATVTQLDQFAFDLATAINAQHSIGFGLDGATGRNLFSVGAAPPASPGAASTIALDPGMVGQPGRVAAANSALTIPGGSDNATALAGLSTRRLLSGNTRTPAEAYSDIVGDVGLRKASANSDREVRDAMKAQIKIMRDSTSGVSLDEEMISLTKYQRAFEAASKLIKTADELLMTIIQEVGR